MEHLLLDGGEETPDYSPNLNLSGKVLNIVQLGGPLLTVGRIIFEMWLGPL